MFGVTEIRDTPEKWQVVGGEEHFAGRIIRVRTDEVLMPKKTNQSSAKRSVASASPCREHDDTAGVTAIADR